MIRHYCDKCEKEIIENVDSRVIDITTCPFGKPVFTQYTFELCNDCLKGLAEYLDTEVLRLEKKDNETT